MSPSDVMELARAALLLLLAIAGPLLIASLITGVVIGLLQALTQVQEMTLTFVPKLGAILAVFWITMSFSGATIVRFYQDQIIPMVVGP